MVFSNCQHLWVFRISAEDAKLMETELQEKVTVKHIISQPTIHCYARLALPGYPLQIISVALIHPASWKDDPSHEKLVQAIRQTNACTSLSASEVDRRYGEHLHRFLDVSASAARLQREARAALAQKQQREAAAQRAQDLAAAQLVTTTKQPSQPTQGKRSRVELLVVHPIPTNSPVSQRRVERSLIEPPVVRLTLKKMRLPCLTWTRGNLLTITDAAGVWARSAQEESALLS